ncbi:MAG: polysaccharide deacetylase family protein [Pseudomonadota bacterium]
MHGSIGLVTLIISLTAATATIACTPNRPGKLQTGRTITIDTDGGVAHGSVSYGETQLLRDKEVILTFDDGPIAGRTNVILGALQEHCVKATFFPVGRMALIRPGILRDTLARGHTIGGHTWSHPNLRRAGLARSKREIGKGFAALEAVIGPRVAPLFRFPYLAESKKTLAYVKSQDIASISIDIDSGDTRGYGVSRVISSTMAQLRRRGRGILLFHDSKLVTVRALPQILNRLAKGGYRVVHLETTSPHRADSDLVARYRRRLDGTPEPKTKTSKPKVAKGLRKTVTASQRAQPKPKKQPSSSIGRSSSDWRSSVFGTQ